ncbi:tRNA isopentenyltransferase [Ephemerocybe angulata]|uniref:tRNA isopentenyltransferase n=1 Tax=Ephemerocybe angulata TaxID=980116 RepID=A0A8H6IIJ3_9AGAR|nr:tRNA isopentenyltransferase [Tulosesus angulatus]
MLKPLITICGTTGVGKSKLAIDLAFGPQGWRGARASNVITNKVPVAEMEGVDHLLMGFKDPGEQYVVGEWVEDSLKLIHEMHQKKEIPIVVGGTSYWIQHLSIPEQDCQRPPRLRQAPTHPGILHCKPQLARSPRTCARLFENLPKEPPSAKVGQRWHWKDTRKVLHSLSIIRSARRRASDIIAEQAADAGPSSQPRWKRSTLNQSSFRTLCFWLFAESSYLEPRLDARVDQMIDLGLLDEIKELRRIAQLPEHAASSEGGGSHNDYTLGIYQAIGYKEFHNYLSDPTDRAFNEAVERMKISTRQYAKKQISWIRNKLMPAVKDANSKEETVSLYVLDAAKVDERWADRVRAPAIEVTEKLLNGEPLPEPRSLSDVAAELLNASDKSSNPLDVLQARQKTQCDICTIQDDRPFMVETGPEWERHIHSRAHKRMSARLKRIQSGQQPYPRSQRETDINTPS